MQTQMTTDTSMKQLTARDIREIGKVMGHAEARFLVDYYYISQDNRIRFNNQVRAMSDEPNLLLSVLGVQFNNQEELIKKALDKYTLNNGVGAWLRTVHGIGPVIAAGFLAGIDIRKAPTAGGLWKFCGVDGVTKWEKGQKRPWNATLKRLCFLAGESFVKTSNSDKSVYGKFYKLRKELEVARNERGDYRRQAAAELASKNYSKDTPTYKCLIEGRLSPAHIQARARRWAVKLFLSHLHEVMYRVILGQMPPNPYPIEHMGHVHKIEIPHADVLAKWADPIGDDIDQEGRFRSEE